MKNKVVFDINRWSYRDLNIFMRDMTDGNFAGASERVMPIIVNWSYDTPLNPNEPFGGLNMVEGVEVLRSVMNTVAAYGDELNTDDIAVDLSHWTFSDFTSFQEALKNNAYATVERLMRKVTDFPEGEEISAVDGMKAMLVITKLVKKVFAGKS